MDALKVFSAEGPDAPVSPYDSEGITPFGAERLAEWNDWVEGSTEESWSKEDQAEADAIAAMAVYADDGWQQHFMRRLAADTKMADIDWQCPEITKLRAEVEGRFGLSEMMDREMEWRRGLTGSK